MLSDNFNILEFTCFCCGHVQVSHSLIKILQKVRDIINIPMVITSGYRCRKHNKEVGGKEDSLHLCGWAADVNFISLEKKDFLNLVNTIKSLDLDGGLGIYYKKQFMHFDCGAKRTWEVLS